MHKRTVFESCSIAARMLFVTSSLVIMPCWAVFWVREEMSHRDRQDVAKVVTTPQPAANKAPPPTNPPTAAADKGHALDPTLTAQTVPATNEAILTIRQLEDRLKELGADYMLLGYHANLNGNQGNYRFLCRMPIPDSAAYARPFEAVAADPVSAMQQVLHQVELWQSSIPSRETVKR